jgi:hypothetical protein
MLIIIHLKFSQRKIRDGVIHLKNNTKRVFSNHHTYATPSLSISLLLDKEHVQFLT